MIPRRRVEALTGGLALLLCGVLVLARDTGPTLDDLAFLTALALLRVCDALPLAGTPRRALALLEGVGWAAAVLTTGAEQSPFLPYLLVPAFTGSLRFGIEGAISTVGWAGIALVAMASSVEPTTTYDQLATGTGEWLVIALVVGLLASWIQRLQQQRVAPEDDYAAAYRLLGQLRLVARHLSAGFDRVALADGLLRSVVAVAPGIVGGAVLVRSDDDRMVVLGTTGVDRLEWELDVRSDSVVGDAWVSQRVQVGTDPAQGPSVALPMVVGARTIGIVGLELAPGQSLAPSVIEELQRLVDPAALRLETALTFDELREIATVEERRRLAREIHDGVAQDLAGLGYLVDGLMFDLRSTPPTTGTYEAVASIRAELTRVISELRASIFTLRHEVDQNGGLAAALTEYVRSASSGSALTVHLTLDESPHRLPADTESELLRIAQEAITNARKHSQATNLWVSCTIDPPRASLIVEDDGAWVSTESSEHSFGLEIMYERARRLRAQLSIQPREPHGTVVSCVVGGAAEAARPAPAGRQATA